MHDDPPTLFRAAVDALSAGDCRAVAELCDPVTLVQLRHGTLADLAEDMRDPDPA